MNQNLIVTVLFMLATGFVALTGLCVYGYRALRRQFDQLVFDGEKVATLSENLVQAAQQFDRFCSCMRETERREIPQPEVRAAAAASNSTNHRAQVLRLHRSGESNASIASALGISQGEVKLMVKVQEMLAETGA